MPVPPQHYASGFKKYKEKRYSNVGESHRTA